MTDLLRLSTLTVLLGLSGCATDGTASDPLPDEHDLGPTLAAADLADVPDGTEGWARIQTPQGIELLPYVALGGQAIYQDDVVLGPIDKVDARLRGGALTSGGDRWTDNYVEYAFHPDFKGTARDVVRQAVADLEEMTPIDFKEVTFGQHTGPWIEFRWGPDDATYAGMSTAIGMMGCGEWHFSPHWGHSRTDCGQWIYFNKTKDQPKPETTKHEVLHALGMWHEQSRNDRDSFVDYNPQCVAQNADQFSKQSSSLDLGPYDYRSIMHYNSGANCMTDQDNDDDPYLLGCSCLTLTKWADLDADGKKDRIDRDDDLTREDVNTLWRGYNERLGVNTSGDDLAKAMAVGDFDGDGYDDVAVGAPGNDSLGANATGAVFVYKATSAKLVPWQMLAQNAIPNQDVAAGDHFGAALAAGDLNGDGFADLVVGVPGEDYGSTVDAGAIHIYYGSKGGLKLARTITQADLEGTNEANDRFGAALAIGPITTYNGRLDIAIGAPGDKVSHQFGTSKSGAVYLMHIAKSSITGDENIAKPTRLAFGFGLTGDDFGAAISIGKLDSDANADIAVGAPGRGGRVFVYQGQLQVNGILAWTSMASYRQMIAGPTNGDTDRFGAALQIANVAGNGSGEIVVGAPGVNNAAGRVFVYHLSGVMSASNPMSLFQTIYPNGSQEAGDEFGASVLAFARDNTAQLDLVVGSPGENDDTGIITLYSGGSTVSVVSNIGQYIIPLQSHEPGDRFGATLGAGQINGAGDNGTSDDFLKASRRRADLVVGAPGETIGFPTGGPKAGAFGVLINLDSQGQLIGTGSYDQETELRD
jgi:hypothetical protein